MYAILLMNALVPFINRATQPRVFGTAGGKGRRHERDSRPSPAGLPSALPTHAEVPPAPRRDARRRGRPRGPRCSSSSTRPRSRAIEANRRAGAARGGRGGARRPRDGRSASACEDGRSCASDEADYEVDTEALDRVFAGYADEAGTQLIGFASGGAYSAPASRTRSGSSSATTRARREVLGVKVLESKETPGLGDKIEKETLRRSLLDRSRGVEPREPRRREAGRGDEAASRTRSTRSRAPRSPRPVIKIINDALGAVGPRSTPGAGEEGAMKPPTPTADLFRGDLAREPRHDPACSGSARRSP